MPFSREQDDDRGAADDAARATAAEAAAEQDEFVLQRSRREDDARNDEGAADSSSDDGQSDGSSSDTDYSDDDGGRPRVRRSGSRNSLSSEATRDGKRSRSCSGGTAREVLLEVAADSESELDDIPDVDEDDAEIGALRTRLASTFRSVGAPARPASAPPRDWK